MEDRGWRMAGALRRVRRRKNQIILESLVKSLGKQPVPERDGMGPETILAAANEEAFNTNPKRERGRKPLPRCRSGLARIIHVCLAEFVRIQERRETCVGTLTSSATTPRRRVRPNRE